MTSVVRFEEWQEPTGTTAATTDASGNVTFDNDVTVSGGATVSGDLTVTGNMTSANQGLVFIKSVNVGSSVATITITDCFNSTYKNYLLKYDSFTMSTIAGVHIRFGSVTSGYYGAMEDTQYTGTQNTTLINNANEITVGLGSTVLGENVLTLNVYAPFSSGQRTGFDSIGHGAGRAFRGGGQVTSTASQTSLTFMHPSGATYSGGTIRVYGFNDG